MKISVITAVRNSVNTIEETLKSVAQQTHKDTEHIIIDGASTDGTVKAIARHRNGLSFFLSEPDAGVYHAMNKGLTAATGDVVGFLNAGDVFASSEVLARVAEVLGAEHVDACYANLVYVAPRNTDRVLRYWQSQDYRSGLFEAGWMPAHPTFYIKRRVYEKYGAFDTQYRYQADFELALRFMRVHGINTVYVPEVWVRFRWGGLSTSSLLTVIKGNLEGYRACRAHGLRIPPWFAIKKILSRLPQFFGN